ncbi:hypothetical protein ACQKIC_20220 [Peribacillus sp. NPDC046944]|uniref:hypothetical protein n=1 Tax=Peribacillus sp. NPDC046944 TaxID=3390607 RepID=UPI003D044BF5
MVTSLFSVTSNAVGATGSDTLIVDKQVKVLKGKKLSSGYKQPTNVVAAKITGKRVSEVVASYNKFNTNTFTYNTIINVHQYDSNKKKWKVIKSLKYNNEDSSFEYITKGKLLDNSKEQVVLGMYSGSGAYLSPIIIGSNDGKTVKKILQPTGEYFNGGAVIKGKQLYLLSNTIVVKKYVYKNKKFYSYKGTGADDRKVAAGAKHLLTLQNVGGHTMIDGYTYNKNGERTIKMKVGEKLSIVRNFTKDSEVYGYRLLFDSGNDILSYGTVFKAKKPGKIVWHIEPEAYNDYSQTVTITIVK